VVDALRSHDPAFGVEIEVVKTTGDRILDVPLAKIGDKGLFTKELDTEILAGRARFAVHSLKDIPTRLPDGLVLAAVTRRADPRDVVLARAGAPGVVAALPSGARVGTSSLRRRAQLRARRPDLDVLDLRGNLNTRLARLDRGDFDAILLAAAGVLRLGWQDRITEFLQSPTWLPAAGQGALGVVARADDEETRERLAGIHDLHTAACTRCERAFLRALEGGCQVPIGALAELQGDRLTLHGLVAALEGDTLLRAENQGPVDEAEGIGRRLAECLIRQGARELLSEARAASVPLVAPAP
jgi:hydroxymethylbilane synthase